MESKVRVMVKINFIFICYSILRWNKWKQSFADEISSCNAVKKRLHRRCFLVKFAKLLRTHFFTEQLLWLLLNKPWRSLWFIVWRSDALVFQHKSILVIQYHAKIVKTKSPFDISLFFKLKYAAILLLSYFVDCE